jgi:hypothetical protein
MPGLDPDAGPAPPDMPGVIDSRSNPGECKSAPVNVVGSLAAGAAVRKAAAAAATSIIGQALIYINSSLTRTVNVKCTLHHASRTALVHWLLCRHDRTGTRLASRSQHHSIGPGRGAPGMYYTPDTFA